MCALRDFEKELIRILLSVREPSEALLTSEQTTLASFLVDLDSAQFVDYEYTVVGYFATCSHPAIPKERLVISSSHVHGVVDGVIVGFALFFEDHQLQIDCHALSEDECPVDARDRGIEIIDELKETNSQNKSA